MHGAIESDARVGIDDADAAHPAVDGTDDFNGIVSSLCRTQDINGNNSNAAHLACSVSNGGLPTARLVRIS